jgi:hypothetical protein
MRRLEETGRGRARPATGKLKLRRAPIGTHDGQQAETENILSEIGGSSAPTCRKRFIQGDLYTHDGTKPESLPVGTAPLELTSPAEVGTAPLELTSPAEVVRPVSPLRPRAGIPTVMWFVLAGCLVVVATLGMGMMFTTMQMYLLIHIGLGVLFVHGFAGGMATMLKARLTPIGERIRIASVIGVAAVAWATAITGTWLVYPGYRAKPPSGAGIEGFPKYALLADPRTAVWHTFGMEWKEHIAWLVPFLATAVAYAVVRHRRVLEREPRVRRGVAGLFFIAFGVAVLAASLGAVINKVAPNDFLGGIL